MYRKSGKRVMDLFFSVLILPIVLISIPFVGGLIWIFDGRPIFYVADRVGKNGAIFRMYKYRTMKVDSPNIKHTDGSTYNSSHDSRVTKIGRILRKTSLDELPQFINVIKGEMSVIGPRPNLATRSYSTYDEVRKKRVSVKPGITGYSQAYFRNSITTEEKFANDCYYVDNLSLSFDIKILIKTVGSVVLGKNIYVSTEAKDASN